MEWAARVKESLIRYEEGLITEREAVNHILLACHSRANDLLVGDLESEEEMAKNYFDRHIAGDR